MEFCGPFPWPVPSSRFYGAITFYLENKENVDAYLEEQDRRWEALSQELANRPDPLRDRLREAKFRERASLPRS